MSRATQLAGERLADTLELSTGKMNAALVLHWALLTILDRSLSRDSIARIMRDTAASFEKAPGADS